MDSGHSAAIGVRKQGRVLASRVIVGDDCTMSFLRRETVLASLLACLPLMACESPVNSGATQVVPVQKPTLDGETCDHSGQCEGELRCIDSICQTSVRSRLGDYYAAAGRVAMQSGDGPGAANEFNLAVTQYETDKVDLPNDVLCGQGRALAWLGQTSNSGKPQPEYCIAVYSPFLPIQPKLVVP